jgi:hypothetical protein
MAGDAKRWKFTAEQRKELLRLRLYPEQVHRLELFLPSIGWRSARGPRMQDVREKLTRLAKALERVERLYVQLSTSRNLTSQEVSTRLYLAQEALKAGLDTLHDLLETATTIVNRAIDDLPDARRSTKRNTAEFVKLILKALALGHCEHFSNKVKPMPAFLIEVRRKKKPFPDIAQIVAEASGEWGVDDAIRTYLKTKAHGKLVRQESHVLPTI